MATESSWDAARWRESYHPAHPRYDQSHSSQAVQLSAPTAINPTSQSAILGPYTHDVHGWNNSKSRASVEPIASGHPPPTKSYTDVSTYRNQLHERHSPTLSGNYGPLPQLANTSPHQAYTGAWRSLHPDERSASTTHAPEAPLTLHIPKTQDLPRISPGYTGPPLPTKSQRANLHTPSQTSLPSFASFSEHAATRADTPDAEGPEIAPMSSRLSCDSCTKLKPMVREVAIAVADLDDNVQTYCNKSATRTNDFPNDNSERTFQWILDRLKNARREMQDVTRRAQPNYLYQQQTPTTGIPSRLTSPSNSLKRQGGWDRDDFTVSKRPRSGASPDDLTGTAFTANFHGDRRVSIDFAPPTAYSPPAEHGPASGYPRQGSPGLLGRSMRALPSPSSMVYPPSAPPSLAPPTVQSVGSPAPSYQASASANSVTSVHLADLQHQVTLKSLALQTLSSEYKSLLQKLQREQVKSRTIEKKTTVADQEVNDLTGRNEDLTEQVKTLEMQVEESEKKREVERAEAAREKEQWGRMLEMGGRLHAKNSEDRQKLVEERDGLLKCVAAYEEERKVRFATFKETMTGKTETSQVASGGSYQVTANDIGLHAGSPAGVVSDVDALKREVGMLKAKIDLLRSSLQNVKGHAHDMAQKSEYVVQQSSRIGHVVDKALRSEEVDATKRENSKRAEDQQAVGSPLSPAPAPHNPTGLSETPPSASKTASASPDKSPNVPGPQGPSQSIAAASASTTLANVAKFGRAVSPGPAELGFHVQPSTSTPEELIKALGPVPAPQGPFQYGSGRFIPQSAFLDDAPEAQPSSRSWPPQELNGEWMMPTVQRCNAADDKTRPYTHVSPYQHAPSPYTPQSGVSMHTDDRSPHTYHSSPGVVRDGDSPSSSSGSGQQRSPVPSLLGKFPGALNEDKLPAARQRLQEVKPPRSFPEMAAPDIGPAAFRHWDPQMGKGAMPPPPRPFSQSSTAAYGPSPGVDYPTVRS